MNILYLHRTQGKGVEGVHINGIIKAFMRQKHAVDVVSPSDGTGSKSKGDKLERLSMSVPEVVFEIMEILYNFSALIKISRQLKTKNYAFIYERYSFFGWAGFTSAKKAKTSFFLEVNYTTYTPLFRKRSKIFLPLARLIEKACFKNADAIFVVTSFLKNQLIDLGVPGSKIFLTPNAVDEELFLSHSGTNSVKDELKLQDKRVIGFVGGFYPWHKLELLLMAVKEIEQRQTNLAILLIGDGPAKEQLVTLARQLDISSKLVFTGQVEYARLPGYITAMEMCVVPNSNNYGSPMKIFEYMALGKPVIAPRLTPLEDIISHGKNGLLFNPGESAGLASCVEMLLGNEDLRKQISVNARDSVIQKHLWKHNADKILDAYATLQRTGDNE